MSWVLGVSCSHRFRLISFTRLVAISGITAEHVESDSSAEGAVQDSQSIPKQVQPHSTGYMDSEWSFSTTTETQLELPEPPRRSIAEARLTLSSNATSLSDSAEQPHKQNESSGSQSQTLPTAEPKSRPSLSTIAQLPDSSYLSALSGSSPLNSQVQIPTFTQLDLPETQSFPARHALPSSILGESQQSISEKTESQPSQVVDRKRTHSTLSVASSIEQAAFASCKRPEHSQPVSLESHTDKDVHGHASKRSKSGNAVAVETKTKAAAHTSPHTVASSSTIPSTTVLESFQEQHTDSPRPGDPPTSSPGRIGPEFNYGTQDMNLQSSSAPSVHLPSSAPSALNIVSERRGDRTYELSQASGNVKSVSQGRGLPVRRPWHGRAGSAPTSELPDAPNVACEPSPAPQTREQPMVGDSDASQNLIATSRSGPQATEDIAIVQQAHETVRFTLQQAHTVTWFRVTDWHAMKPPSPVSIDSPVEQRLHESSKEGNEDERRLDRESQPGTNDRNSVETLSGGQRLFVRDGKLYYLASVIEGDNDTFRVDFDDGSFSEVSRASLQRNALIAELFLGDTLVSSSQKKQGSQQRYAFVEQQSSVSGRTLKKDATVTVKPVSGRQSMSNARESVNESVVQLSVSTLALVAGPHTQDKTRAIDVDSLFPPSKSLDAQTTRVNSGQNNIKSNVFANIGMLFTSIDNVCGMPAQAFVKCNGATVVENFDSVIHSALLRAGPKGKGKDIGGMNTLASLDTILLISRGHVTTPKYLQALALGVPCVSPTWLEDCAQQRQLLCWKPYACEMNASKEKLHKANQTLSQWVRAVQPVHHQRF